jgi:hypothetical protein
MLKWLFASVFAIVLLINAGSIAYVVIALAEQGARINKLYVNAIAITERAALPLCKNEAIQLGYPNNPLLGARETDFRYGFVTREDNVANFRERFDREPWRYIGSFALLIDISLSDLNLKCLYYIRDGTVRFLSSNVERLPGMLKKKIEQDNVLYGAAVDLSSRP